MEYPLFSDRQQEPYTGEDTSKCRTVALIAEVKLPLANYGWRVLSISICGGRGSFCGTKKAIWSLPIQFLLKKTRRGM